MIGLFPIMGDYAFHHQFHQFTTHRRQNQEWLTGHAISALSE